MTVDTFVFPTSFAQRRLWFVHQLEPESPVYNLSLRLSLSGTLNADALERALATIVARHETLRTTFALANGEPVQVIAPELGRELVVEDLEKVPAERREDEVRRRTLAAMTAPFDLERGPLFRACLLRVAPEEHVLLLVLHHIIFDGWSAGILRRELSECYRAYSVGESPRLPELAVQYADFAVWQREWLKGEAFERQLSYWRDRLSGAHGVLELPSDFPRGGRRSYRGASEQALFPLKLLQDVKALGLREGATLYMTLLAAFQTLLMRYCGQRDIIVGSPIANRTRSELEQLIGFFVNSIVLRTDLSGDPSFRAMLGRVREVALGAYGHQDLPFDRVVQELQRERTQNRNPLFQVMFSLQNAPRGSLRLPGMTIRQHSGGGGSAKFDLTLYLSEQSRGLLAILEYSTDLFRSDTISRMLGHYRTLLEGIVANPDRRLSALPLLMEDEHRQVVVGWNRTNHPYPSDRGVHQLFEAQAAERPNAIAVEDGVQRLTYRELNQRANRLAWHLRRLGIAPEVRVGVALERSADLIVTLLGVLKAGGAYLPLDVSYPSERLAFMMKDGGMGAVVAHAGARLALESEVPLIDLERDQDALLRECDENLDCEIRPQQLAYVMYTSGSTGKPKGIAIPHEAIVRLVRNTDYVELTPEDRVAQVSNASFDAATFEVWGALLNGASLLIVNREVSLSPSELAAQIRERGITAMFLTTALFNQVARDAPGAFRPVSHLLFGGEAVDPRLVREVLLNGPPRRLLHVYGPTETTTFATWHEVGQVAEDAVTVPIGRPLANTRAYVLDRRMNPTPIGVPGELYLGGPGLARGYLGRPGPTAEHFVPDPFGVSGDGGGGRLYRTGDRVRWRPDGTLEFLGRLDDQVKLRGFRIEPGDIEAALARHPAVRECAVVARDDLPGGRALVAYVALRAVASNGRYESHLARLVPEIRTHLRDRLPEYMLPSRFMVLDALPLSPNGKVDRHALPAPDGTRPELAAGFAAPSTPTERSLAELWRQLLGLERVGRDDNFWELGGHSLLAIKLFADIERVFGTRLPLSTLFQAPTLRGLAEALAGTPASDAGTLRVLRAAGSRPPLFMVHGVHGHVIEYRELVNRLGADQPVYGFEVTTPTGGGAVLRSFEESAAEYLRELRRQQPSGPYFLCGYCWAGPLAFEMACQLREAGQDVALVGLIDSFNPRRQRRAPDRLVARARDHWTRIARNLRRLGALEPSAMPVFFRERLVNFGMRFAGATAYRWSVRLGRPLLPAFREVPGALFQAGKCYHPRRYAGEVTVFRAASGGKGRDPGLGWGELADGVTSHEISGEHLSLMREPHVEDLAKALRAAMDRALR